MRTPPSPTIEERARSQLLQRMADLLKRNPEEPKWWSDADKLRLTAAALDKRDHDQGIFDQNEVQTDLRRIADQIEQCTCQQG